MKKIINCAIASLLIVCCTLSLGILCKAETDKTENTDILETETNSTSITAFPSHFLGNPKHDMDAVIKDLTEKELSSSSTRLEKGGEYTCDASQYLVVYGVGDDFWDDVKSFDYNGVAEAITYKDHPTVYVPVFAEVTGKRVNAVNRQLWSIKLTYDSHDDEYVSEIVGYYGPSNYREINGPYEKISRYLSENKIKAQNVFLISYWSDSRCAAVVQAESDAFVLDISNSAQPEGVEYADMTARSYSISEYASLRKEAEIKIVLANKDYLRQKATLYQELIKEKFPWLAWPDWIRYSIAGTVVFAAVVIFTVLICKRFAPKTEK